MKVSKEGATGRRVSVEKERRSKTQQAGRKGLGGSKWLMYSEEYARIHNSHSSHEDLSSAKQRMHLKRLGSRQPPARHQAQCARRGRRGVPWCRRTMDRWERAGDCAALERLLGRRDSPWRVLQALVGGRGVRRLQMHHWLAIHRRLTGDSRAPRARTPEQRQPIGRRRLKQTRGLHQTKSTAVPGRRRTVSPAPALHSP
ncbi:hypothetical protein K505DRAFT_340049 [Melanomma pulvis-pyrius CBS 109.77]|uniref:Uncharacterized protein n=1 Tax=Melanomma pulvis-pyrius CBS 109.77 TaxID=1314802 RepID=A0A6A6X3I8_9PLEO|nr:hypothetical protein K505DRAFT_340049 [Melanomma pulvis-pyrius CBS 109.77]